MFAKQLDSVVSPFAKDKMHSESVYDFILWIMGFSLPLSVKESHTKWPLQKHALMKLILYEQPLDN